MFIDDLRAARVRLTTVFPYYGRIAFALQFVEKPGLGTLGVDKNWRCYYDPEVKNMWTVEELTGVLAHECNHLLRIHMDRMPMGINPMVWNICGDAEINDDLSKHLKQYGNGISLPDGCVYPNKFTPPAPDNLTAEEYLRHLRDNASDDPNGKGMPLYDDYKDCGSAAGGKPREYEDGADPANGQGVSETQGDLIRRQTAKDVVEHQKATGQDAGELGRWAEELLNPTIDWRKALSAIIRNAYAYSKGEFDYTYRSPSYRKGWSMEEGKNYIMPGTESPIPSVTCIVDTSGSIGQKELTQAVTEIKGICEALDNNTPLTVMAVDAAIHSTKQVFDAKQVTELRGGGGTDMRLGIAAAVKNRSQICIVITDGYTPWPDSRPKTKVVVALLPNGDSSKVPAWAKLVQITE